MHPIASIVGQVAPNLKQVSNSGIDKVTGSEWLLAGAVFVASILAAFILRRVVERLVDREGSRAVGRLAGRLTAFVVVVLGFFYALSSVDVAVGPLLGGLGIIGIALAFSLQEILGNFAAGVLLHVRRPIRVGEQIVTNELEGEVEDVNFRSVQLRCFDGETVFVPNSMVLDNPITNWTRTPERRTTLEIGLTYDADLDRALEVLVEAMEGCEYVLAEPEPQAFVYEFGENSINVAVRVWHRAEIIEMWRARDEAARAAKRALDAAGLQIPFPQRTLWWGDQQPATNGDGLSSGARASARQPR